MNHHMAFMAIHFVLNLSLLVHLQYYHASHIIHAHVIEKIVQKQVEAQLNVFQLCLTLKQIPCLIYINS
jgi:hypothetical protein